MPSVCNRLRRAKIDACIRLIMLILLSINITLNTRLNKFSFLCYFAIPESISGIFFGLIPFKATGSHLSEIQCTVTIKIPQDALLVKLIYLIFLISFAYYLFIFVKILDAPTRFCYTESSYKEDLSKMMDINYE